MSQTSSTTPTQFAIFPAPTSGDLAKYTNPRTQIRPSRNLQSAQTSYDDVFNVRRACAHAISQMTAAGKDTRNIDQIKTSVRDSIDKKSLDAGLLDGISTNSTVIFLVEKTVPEQFEAIWWWNEVSANGTVSQKDVTGWRELAKSPAEAEAS